MDVLPDEIDLLLDRIPTLGGQVFEVLPLTELNTKEFVRAFFIIYFCGLIGIYKVGAYETQILISQ